MEKERIQKIIADFGVCSRRKAEILIKNGFVKCNGKTAVLGEKASGRDEIIINGQKLCFSKKKEFKYIMLNKPRGYLSSVSDKFGRKCVVDLVSTFKQRLYPVGRLDLNSEGLIILTNDGFLANKIMHPTSNFKKTYRVTLNRPLSLEHIKKISSGVLLDGYRTRKAEVKQIFEDLNRAVVLITIHEGKNRQIRRTMELFGFKVRRLKRMSIGPLKLGTLRPAEFRSLSEKELKMLKEALNLKS